MEAIVTGDEAQLQQFINWCKTGPEKANVTDVIITFQPETFFTHFEIVRG